MCLILSEEYDQRRYKNTSTNVIRLLYSLQIVLFNMFKMLNMYTWLGNECHFCSPIQMEEESNTVSETQIYFNNRSVLLIMTVFHRINNPCPGCEKAYGFRNVLALNQNATFFKVSVMNLQ